MRKNLLSFMLCTIVSTIAIAQTAELPFYPTFRYDNWNNNSAASRPNGFVKVIEVTGAADGAVMKRVGALPDESLLKYAPDAEQRSLSNAAIVNGTAHSTDVYAVSNPLNIPNNSGKEIQVSFWDEFKYAGGDYQAIRELLVTDNLVYKNDGVTIDALATVWEIITPGLAANSAGWTNQMAILPAAYKGKVIHMAFRYAYDISNAAYTSGEDKPGTWVVAELKVNEVDEGTTIPTSIDELTDKVVYFSPNPAQDKLMFHSGVKSYKIFSLSGQMVEQSAVLSPSVNISHLSKGVYLLCIDLGNGNSVTEKLLKL